MKTVWPVRVKSSVWALSHVTQNETGLLIVFHLHKRKLVLKMHPLHACSARFWLKKLLAQVHATQNIYLHNIVGTCTKEGLDKENTTQIAKYKKHSDLIP